VVELRRPIGIHVVEGPGKSIIVAGMKPDLGAAKSKRVRKGDRLMAMSASWGQGETRAWDEDKNVCM
jgi:DNA repair ATPase RecN